MRRIKKLIVFLLFGWLLGLHLTSCHFVAPDPNFDVNHRFLTLPPKPQTISIKDPRRFSFVFFADIQVDTRLKASLRTPALAALKRYLTDAPVDFLISGGDNTERGTQDEYEYIDRELRALGLPIVWCIGNHDLFSDGWKQWQKMYGTTIRTLRIGQTSIYILDNAGGTVGSQQRKWLETQLQQDDALHKVIVMHFPLYSGNHYELDGQAHMREAYTLSALFDKYKIRHVLAGHTHIFRKVRVNDIPYTVVSALKENAQNKVIVRIDVDGASFNVRFIKLTLEGYIE
jgi:3',5'-cyclic AMP phosphodiesterase CpdA